MDRIGAAAFRNIKNLFEVEIGLGRGGSPDRIGLIGLQDVQRYAVRIRIHRNRRNFQLAAGTDDPHRDFSSIGDKNLLEHERGASALRTDNWKIKSPFRAGRGFRLLKS